MLDLVIIGGSAAGITAGIYAARRQINFKIITDNIGGEMATSGVVGNWPGIKEVRGFELAKNFSEHIKSYGTQMQEGWKVEKIAKKDSYHVVFSKNAKGEEAIDEAKAVIIASGIHPKQLRVPGEKEFFHKGVTYCTVCDGPLFKNKITATIGDGNSALESALMMSGIAKKVYIVSITPDTPETNSGFPTAEKILVEKVKSTPNIEILHNAFTQEITGDKSVNGLKYKNEKGEENTLEVQGVMVHIGNTPNSSFVDFVEKNKLGEIMTDKKGQTSQPGIFAAGDVTDLPFKQIVIASGQGCTAALSAIDYINKWKE